MLVHHTPAEWTAALYALAWCGGWLALAILLAIPLGRFFAVSDRRAEIAHSTRQKERLTR